MRGRQITIRVKLAVQPFGQAFANRYPDLRPLVLIYPGDTDEAAPRCPHRRLKIGLLGRF